MRDEVSLALPVKRMKDISEDQLKALLMEMGFSSLEVRAAFKEFGREGLCHSQNDPFGYFINRLMATRIKILYAADSRPYEKRSAFDKALRLAECGFVEERISTAFYVLGPNASIEELTRHIIEEEVEIKPILKRSSSEIPAVLSKKPRFFGPTVAEPPYFLFGGAANVSDKVWNKLSQDLYCIKPEIESYSGDFSVFRRREGYIHNLPTRGRSKVAERKPLTVRDAVNLAKLKKAKMTKTALPHNWQDWVTRENLGQVNFNEAEHILGYPINHTDKFTETKARVRALKHCLRTDTLEYFLSFLKNSYVNGITVLSIYGIGGVEIALRTLGIRINYLVTVQTSETDREILTKWWFKTDSDQQGTHIEINDITELTNAKLENFSEAYGVPNFDLVFCSIPWNSKSESPTSGSSSENAPTSSNKNRKMNFEAQSFEGEYGDEIDISSFQEAVRVLMAIRSKRNKNRR